MHARLCPYLFNIFLDIYFLYIKSVIIYCSCARSLIDNNNKETLAFFFDAGVYIFHVRPQVQENAC